MEKKVKDVKNVKETKKVKKLNKVKFETSEQAEMKSFLIVILVVIVCVGAVYLITRAFVTKDLFKKDEPETEEVITGVVNYDVAIVGQIMNRPYNEYYVVVYDSTGDYNTDMTMLINNYKAKKEVLHTYVVDLSNKLNESYYDPENVNESPTGVSDMKFGDITLMKVKKGKVVKYITDLSKMEKELGVE